MRICSGTYMEAYNYHLSIGLNLAELTNLVCPPSPLLMSARNLFDQMHAWLIQSVAHKH